MNPLKEGMLLARGVWACVDLVRNPDRLERVHDITNALASRYPQALDHMRELFGRDSRGAAALREKRRLHPDVQELSQLSQGTLGRAFADHILLNRIDGTALPETGDRVGKPKRPFGDELKFIRAHIYDTHDVWHVVTGFGVDVAGELGLQAFCAAQTPYALPSLLLGLGFLNTAVFGLNDSERRMNAISRGWQMGQRAQPLFGMHWEELWTRPLEEVRRSLRVEPYREVFSVAA
jgi:ubiquinone biosynthesis protein Coq4